MVIFLLKIIFMALSTLSSILLRLIFTVTAYLIVFVIQAFKVPGETIQSALEKVADVIKACFEYLMEIVMEVISTLISTFFDLLKENIIGSLSATGSAMGGLVDKTRTSVEGLLEDFPEVLEGLSDMITTMLTDIWNNSKDALEYISQNA